MLYWCQLLLLCFTFVPPYLDCSWGITQSTLNFFISKMINNIINSKSWGPLTSGFILFQGQKLCYLHSQQHRRCHLFRSVEQCHYTYITKFRPTQEQVIMTIIIIITMTIVIIMMITIVMINMMINTPSRTNTRSCIMMIIVTMMMMMMTIEQAQVCTENFKKRCQISFKQQAYNETVPFIESSSVSWSSQKFIINMVIINMVIIINITLWSDQWHW